MALHIHQLWIEYNEERQGYHPYSVYVKRGTGNQAEQTAEFHGKSLSSLLKQAAKHVAEQEAAQMPSLS